MVENDTGATAETALPEGVGGVDELLSEFGFDADSSMLTRRQAEVLVLREHGLKQATIADLLGTSRANVSGVETSARENVQKARETVTFIERLSVPVHLEIPPGTDLYDVPDMIFEACDEAGVKVSQNAPELMKVLSDGATEAIDGRAVQQQVFVDVTSDGTVRIQ